MYYYYRKRLLFVIIAEQDLFRCGVLRVPRREKIFWSTEDISILFDNGTSTSMVL
jgi:hypothetical protein